MNDLDTAPLEWKIGDVRSLAQNSAVTDGSITLRIAVGSRQFITDQLLNKAEVIRAMHDRVQHCQDPQTEFALLRESLGVSRINHVLQVHGHKILEEQHAAAVYGFKRVRDSAAPAHMGALIAGKPRIQGLIRDAGHLPEQILETRLSEVIETATSTDLSTLDSDEQATVKLYVQKAAQVADEAWQQTIAGLQGPGVANPTIAPLEHPSSASQEEDSDDTDFSAPRKSRLSGPQLQAQLSRLTDRSRLRRLKDTLLSKGAWQQVTRIEDLCHAQVSHKWLYHLDACC